MVWAQEDGAGKSPGPLIPDFNAGTKKATNPTIIATEAPLCDYMQYLAMAKGEDDNRLAIVNHHNLYVWDLEGDLGPVQLTFEENIHSASFLPDGSGFVVGTYERNPSIYIVGNDGYFLDKVSTISKGSFGLAYPDYREID